MSQLPKQTPTLRSSAAEYLTFIAASGEGGVEAVYADEDVWLSQKMMGELYDVNVRTVSEHLKNIFLDNELEQDSVVRKFRITASDGKNYNTNHYNLSGIIAVGYKVNSERAVQFRKCVTAAEVVYSRADADKTNMGLTSWKDAPDGKIQKFDVSVAKNYLTDNELAQLQRLVNAYLDIAEDMALRKLPMTMADWEQRLNRFIEATDREVLKDAGKVTAEIAKAHAETEFEKYRIVQDRLYESDFDKQMKALERDQQQDLLSSGDGNE
ncbi:RhuM family protein [Leucothrix pacifica]|uniref:Cell filamentation protein Fic n=1 Tax=Leucothrix pacifica TaxID=1247513 RepID=A0A317C0V6_9GAMM|nr:RhuM family protein [Leucothrix pacifica]PWQ92275.1 hypothetical protein DKW60_21975 [Leucothrix pacifica]